MPPRPFVGGTHSPPGCSLYYQHPSNAPKSRETRQPRRCPEARRPSPRSGARHAQLRTATADTGSRGEQTAGTVTRCPRMVSRGRGPGGHSLALDCSHSVPQPGRGHERELTYTFTPASQLPQAQTSKLWFLLFKRITSAVNLQQGPVEQSEQTALPSALPASAYLPHPAAMYPGLRTCAVRTGGGVGWGVQTGKYTGWR